MADDNKSLENLTKAIDELNRIFKFDRYLYLILAASAFIFLLVFVGKIAFGNELPPQQIVALFGCGGAIGISLAQIRYFSTEAFGLLKLVLIEIHKNEEGSSDDKST